MSRTLAKFGRLSDFILVLDGDSRGLEEKLETIAERHGHAVHVLFLPGDGPPEQWLWDAVRKRPDAYAERLGITAADMQRTMRDLERLVDGAVQQQQDMAKVAIRSLAHRLERTVADVARIVGQREARTDALYELVDGLRKLIEQWRRVVTRATRGARRGHNWLSDVRREFTFQHRAHNAFEEQPVSGGRPEA